MKNATNTTERFTQADFEFALRAIKPGSPDELRQLEEILEEILEEV